jgi:hypothetical protein
VPRLRSLFFNVAESDPLFAASDQGVLRRVTPIVAETSNDGDNDDDDDDNDDNGEQQATNALEEEEEYEARPISAALDAGKFSLMPAATTDSFLASLFEGPTKTAAAEVPPPTRKAAAPASSQPQRVFRLFAPNSASDSSAISPAMQARQSSQPVAGIKSQALLGQLDRKAKKEQQKAQQQKTIDVQSATITKPKPLFDIAAMLAPVTTKARNKKKNKQQK